MSTLHPTLAQLRARIDELDGEIHRLLIERGQVIDALIDAKRGQETGSAFRPAREAGMIRALLQRHTGRLPVETIVQIWRDIISTFTYLQAPYQLYVEALDRRDVAERVRAMFGFVVPLCSCPDAQSVCQALSDHPEALGIVSLDGIQVWWRDLPSSQLQVVGVLPDLSGALYDARVVGLIVGSTDIPTEGLPQSVWAVQASTRPLTSQILCGVSETYWCGLVLLPAAVNTGDVPSHLGLDAKDIASAERVGYADATYWQKPSS